MKKICFILAALCALCLLASCSQESGGAENKTTSAAAPSDAAVSTEADVVSSDSSDSADSAIAVDSSDATGDSTEDATDGDEADASSSAIRQIADAVVDSGLFGSSMELYFKGDDFADDLLEYKYGVEDAEKLHIEDYVISEQTSKDAYSFAFVVFGDGYEESDFKAVLDAFADVYVDDLAAALEAYNPEGYAMCSDALIEGWTLVLEGDVGVRCAYLIISDDNSAAAHIVSDAANAAFAPD